MSRKTISKNSLNTKDAVRTVTTNNFKSHLTDSNIKHTTDKCQDASFKNSFNNANKILEQKMSLCHNKNTNLSFLKRG